MSASQITTAFGSGTKVAQLTGFENGELQFKTASSINANEPYLIKVASDFTSAAVSGVNIVEGTPEKTNIEGVDFIGSYAATIDIPASDASNSYYFLSNSQLYKTAASGTANTLKTLRAYFKVATTGEGRELTFTVDGDVTAIRNLTPALSQGEGAWYDLQGRRISQPQKGLYIVNGKKVVIK